MCCAKPGTILAVAHSDTNHCQPLHTTNNKNEQDQKVAKLTLRLCGVESCDFGNFLLKISKIKTILKILKEVPPDIVCHGFWKKMGILQLMIS